ncbi:hypothetical protein HAP48_0027245 [Bradyrhizobium septentrionale]|uniref:Uncharacterized protein n=1 Tax=Bradyrhizobium septentrionale TaxID=1404411 RepID=A0A973VX76_9BRAD|nr:hypothetical protein [Bradyrhizobium septentrionale]UGY12354.1 hypothetical protein HAP48_0027245 [Bradyrhizobium septentrionale]UGY25536.1 hypothetical protein HU675_0000945 [Bradyrhizobium septentrionale]
MSIKPAAAQDTENLQLLHAISTFAAHHKNKALVRHPFEETHDGETVKFYAEEEDILIICRSLVSR